MIQGGWNTNLPGTVIGGVPAMGVTGMPFGTGGFGAGGVDVDPITPGIQMQPGVLTATGPSRVVGGGGMMSSGYRGVGVGFGGIGYGGAAGVVDADPITPGIQSQPGVVTPTGPPRIVGGPGTLGGTIGGGVMASGYRGVGVSGIGTAFAGSVGGGVVDADPITPGIQAQPGVVTPTGPPRVVGGPGAVGGALSGAFAGTAMTSGIARSGFIGVDADPITPGVQGSPGIVTPIGPSKVIQAGYGSGLSQVGYGYRNCAWCPWWLWTLLGLLLLGGIIGGLYSWNTHRRERGLRGVNEGSSRRGETSVAEDDDEKRQEDDKDINVKTAPKDSSDGDSTSPSAATNTTASTGKDNTEQPRQTSTNSGDNTSGGAQKTEPKASGQDNKKPDETADNSTAANEGGNETKQPSGSGNTDAGTQTTPPATGESTQGNQNPNQGGDQGKQGGDSRDNKRGTFGSRNRSNRRNKSRYLKRIVTKTTYDNQVVQPIYTDPVYQHRHLKRKI